LCKTKIAFSHTHNLVSRQHAVFAIHQKRITTDGPVKEMFAPRDVFVVSRMGMHFDILSTISRVGSERCALWCYRNDRTLYALSLMIDRSVHLSRDLYVALLNSIFYYWPRNRQDNHFSSTVIPFCKLSLLSCDLTRHYCDFIACKSLFVSFLAYLSYFPIFLRIHFSYFSKESRAVSCWDGNISAWFKGTERIESK